MNMKREMIVALAGYAAFSAALTCDAALKWNLSGNAKIEGDRLVVDVPKGERGGGAWAEVDIAACGGNAVGGKIRVRGENVEKTALTWEGMKFMLHYVNAEGADLWPQAEALHGTFGWTTVSFRHDMGGIPSKDGKGAVTLGIQNGSGRLEFDLSSLRIGPAEPIWPRVNVNRRVRYPKRVSNLGPQRGVMLPAGPCKEDDFATLKKWGATLARYQMVNGWLDDGANRDLDEFDRWLDGKLDHLERDVIPWARKYGIRLVVDLHVTPGGRQGSELAMFHDRKCADRFVACWKRIATRFKGNSDIIFGYDLVNEPEQQREALPDCDYWSLQRRAAEAVRRIDPETTIIVESNGWDSPSAFRYLSPLDMDNVIYQVHVYGPHDFTHQSVGGRPRVATSWPDLSKGWDREYLRRHIAPVVDFQQRHGARIYVGEFSAIAWADGADRYLADCISLFEEYGFDWSYHAFREWEGWSVEHECDGPDKPFRASSDNPRLRVLKAGFSSEPPKDLHDLFARPPREARLRAIWHWMGDDVRAEAIVRDLSAMKQIGIASVTIVAPHMCWQPKQVRLMSPEWIDLFALAVAEAKKRGMELGFHNCPGWSASGGPWIDPAHSMKEIVASEIAFESDGASSVPVPPEPKSRRDFYRDIATWAFPDAGGEKAVADPAAAVENPKTLPKGRWRVVRVGFTTTGRGPAPSTLEGLECDKFSKEALDIHWNAMPAKLLAVPGAKGTITHCFIDSFEAGRQNWSECVPSEFEKKYGREPGVDILALAGYRVGTEEESRVRTERFRALFSELVSRNYYGHFTELCHRAGVESLVEPYGSDMFDMNDVTRRIDRPMAEFWLGPPMADPDNPAKVSSAAYAAGRGIVAAEAFTTDEKPGRWQATPADLRRTGDLLGWAKGVNQIVYHSYVMQPYVNLRPGMSLGQHGSQLNVNTTWWPEAREWSRYVARGQALLQAGSRRPLGVELPSPLEGLRRDRGRDSIYFIANPSPDPFSGAVRLPAAEGTVPEIFDAVDGSVASAPREKDGRIALTLAPSGSVFVVWTKTGSPNAPKAPARTILDRVLDDGWKIVSFEGQNAPEPRALGRLADWSASDDPKLRYFSGRARYRHALGTKRAMTLDLGDVRDVANVYVDGKKVACLWQSPYATEIPAGSVLEVEVVNTWPNRLIGDAILRRDGTAEPMPESGPRFPLWVKAEKSESGTGITTWSNFDFAWKADDPLRPAGLIGPVRLLR